MKQLLCSFNSDPALSMVHHNIDGLIQAFATIMSFSKLSQFLSLYIPLPACCFPVTRLLLVVIEAADETDCSWPQHHPGAANWHLGEFLLMR